MNGKLLSTIAAALSLSLSAIAQTNCPRERAVAVPQRVEYGPAVTCPGLTYRMPGLTLQTATGCPLFVTVTPAHERVERSAELTKVDVVGRDPVQVFFFRCHTTYLLFIPLSSYCAYDTTVNAGTVLRLTTVGCAL